MSSIQRTRQGFIVWDENISMIPFAMGFLLLLIFEIFVFLWHLTFQLKFRVEVSCVVPCHVYRKHVVFDALS